MAQTDLVVELARFIERIAATARTGLAFKPDGYDAERYHELLREASAMHALLGGLEAEHAREIERRWRGEVLGGFDGYVTAAVGCGAIVFNHAGEVLMLRRPNGRWWYPTGFCDVGLSPAENVVKEVREETGLEVTPLGLMAVTDSRKQGSAARHIYSLLFYCRLDGGELRPNPLEALDAGFFPLDRTPQPQHGASDLWLQLARQFHFEGRREAYFDPL